MRDKFKYLSSRHPEFRTALNFPSLSLFFLREYTTFVLSHEYED